MRYLLLLFFFSHPSTNKKLAFAMHYLRDIHNVQIALPICTIQRFDTHELLLSKSNFFARIKEEIAFICFVWNGVKWLMGGAHSSLYEFSPHNLPLSFSLSDIIAIVYETFVGLLVPMYFSINLCCSIARICSTWRSHSKKQQKSVLFSVRFSEYGMHPSYFTRCTENMKNLGRFIWRINLNLVGKSILHCTKIQIFAVGSFTILK